MTEPFLTQEQQLANQALVLRNHGHVNVTSLIQMYEIQRLHEPATTWVEYVDPEGMPRTAPIDLSIEQVVIEASQLGVDQENTAAETWGLTPGV